MTAKLDRDGLNAKERAFVDALLEDPTNLKEAARKAGSKAKDSSLREVGSRLMKRPRVRAALEKARAERAERVRVSTDWVLANLKEVAERCMQVAPVLDRKGEQVYVETPNGKMVPAFTFKPGGATKALQLIGKHLGMFKEQIDVNVKGKITLEQLIGGAESRDDGDGGQA